MSEKDIGKKTAEASVDQLAQLNQYVNVKAATDALDEAFLSKFKVCKYQLQLCSYYYSQVVVLTNNKSLEELLRINEICRKNSSRFIVADTRGVFGVIFCDFGDKFIVYDKDGEEPLSSIVTNVTKVGSALKVD